MIEEIQDDIIERLMMIDGVATVSAWQGEIDDLLKTPQRMPSLHVIYQGADFAIIDSPAGQMETPLVTIGIRAGIDEYCFLEIEFKDVAAARRFIDTIERRTFTDRAPARVFTDVAPPRSAMH